MSENHSRESKAMTSPTKPTVASLADELMQLVREFQIGERQNREGIWNEIAAFTINNSEEIATALRSHDDMRAAGILALEAIDNILSSHEGQAEHAELKAAFDALESALPKGTSNV